MTNYRRRRVPGGTYFFTVCLEERGSETLIAHVDLLRQAYRALQAKKPFTCRAMVVLPDHLHAVWTLPAGDADFSNRWGFFKARFSRDLRVRLGLPPIRLETSRGGKGDAGIWQRRFWEHHLRDVADLRVHMEYCWSDPVRHGLVRRAGDWTYSSIHREIEAGRLPAQWRGGDRALRFPTGEAA